MKITVALTAYNGAEYLSSELESILKQTRVPDEILIGDDSRDDRTRLSIQTLLQENPERICYFRNAQQLGVQRNWEALLKRATGDLIILADQDDLFLPEKVAAFEHIAQYRIDADGFFSDSIPWDAEKSQAQFPLPPEKQASTFELRGLTAQEQSFFNSMDQWSFLLRKSVISGHNIAIRRRALNYVLPFPDFPGLYADTYLTLAIGFFSRWELMPDAWMLYRIHSGNQSAPSRTSPWQKMQDAKLALTKNADASYYNILADIAAKSAARKLANLPEWEKKHELLERKQAFLSRRIAMNHWGVWRRVPMVLREIFSGNYWTLGHGISSVMIDLFLRGTAKKQ